MRLLLIILLSLGVVALTFLFFTKLTKKDVPPENHQQEVSTAITGQMAIDTLGKLGYFKFTDSTNLELLKKDLRETYDQYQILTTIEAEKPPYTPYCRRLYSCDHETLFEADGIVTYLKVIKPTFDKLNIPLIWSDDYFSDNATEHTIVVNGKKYIAFKGDPNDMLIWAWAAKNFVEMLNDQLQLHHSDERVYLISGGNDGKIIFLTKAQHDFIDRHFDKEELPKDVNTWWKAP